MALTCENCGAENLETNRYCGQCGSKLVAPLRDDTPEEFWREPSHAWSSADEAVTDVSGTAQESSDTASFLQRNNRQEAEERARTGASPDVAVSESSQAGVDQFTQYPVQQHSAMRTGVSGPSFLGLTDDDGSPDYGDDLDEPRSHMRRNLALVILAIAAALVTLQWHSIRDYGLAYIRNGSQKVQQGSKPAQASPAELASSTGREPSAANPVNSGEPQSVQNSPNAGHELPTRQSGTSQPAPAASQQQPSAMGASADVREIASRPAPPTSADSNFAARTRPSQATHESERRPGSDEMRHAARASDPGDRATWLWRAVGKGNPEAPIQLAAMYEMGDGVVRSCDQAQLLLRAAASRGNGQAKANLLQLLREGCPAR